MELVLPAWLFFDAGDSRPHKLLKNLGNTRAKKERRLYCAACLHSITTQDERISVNGAHEHTFTNPLGIVYHVGCFQQAMGCGSAGGATSEHSWFPGYQWKVALCLNCQVHLGWLFVASTDRFHALIVQRLTSLGKA